MSLQLARLKPGAPRSVHLLLAASLWTAIGLLLMTRGLVWLKSADLLYLALPAVLLGYLKSRFILDRTAVRSIERILHLRDGTCLGAVYSKMTWLLVAAMMGMGILLRRSSFPRPILAVAYIMVGWALFWSSRKGWRAWRRNR
ncbi:MAG: hypothetical protein ACK5PS_15380 [Desulfopila sp.]